MVGFDNDAVEPLKLITLRTQDVPGEVLPPVEWAVLCASVRKSGVPCFTPATEIENVVLYVPMASSGNIVARAFVIDRGAAFFVSIWKESPSFAALLDSKSTESTVGRWYPATDAIVANLLLKPGQYSGGSELSMSLGAGAMLFPNVSTKHVSVDQPPIRVDLGADAQSFVAKVEISTPVQKCKTKTQVRCAKHRGGRGGSRSDLP